MNLFNLFTSIGMCLIVCLVSMARAGGDKSARTTVITLAGGGHKGEGYPIPIPIPICSGHQGFGYGGGSGGGGHNHLSRMGWRRR